MTAGRHKITTSSRESNIFPEVTRGMEEDEETEEAKRRGKGPRRER
jgi:hypothetical protein